MDSTIEGVDNKAIGFSKKFVNICSQESRNWVLQVTENFQRRGKSKNTREILSLSRF